MNKIRTTLAHFDDQWVRLTKTGSKRNGWVDVGSVQTGSFSFVKYRENDTLPDLTGVMVSKGFRYLRTSPLVEVTEVSEMYAILETEGGTYLLEIMGKEVTCESCGHTGLPVEKLHDTLCGNCRIVLA